MAKTQIKWSRQLLEQKLQAGTIAGYKLPENMEPEKKSPKYKNNKTEIDGITFDSKKEAFRYRELSLLQKTGEISGLQCQVRYLVIEATDTTKAAYYVADFVYFRKGQDAATVEDVKSTITRKLPTYILKKKLMKTVYNIYILET